MGIQRWGKDGVDYRLVKSDEGNFVMFTDHEQVVAELRSALAAKSAEVEGLRAAMFKVYCVAANGGKLSRLHIEIERMRNAMEKSNEHQDQ